MSKLIVSQDKFATNVALLINKIHELGFLCSLGEVYRTPEMAQIYKEEGKGIANSLHCKRLAIDIQLFDKDGKYLIYASHYDALGVYWKMLSPQNRFGGDFPSRDANHFEMHDC